MSLVEVAHLRKKFPSQRAYALDDLSFSIPPGHLVGVVGPDGAGKTTLLRLMAGLLRPSSGSITIEGRNTLNEAEKIHLITGYMPQRFGLYEDLTVMQNLLLYADLKGVVGEARSRQIERLLQFTTLDPFSSRLARDLSGGMKQKLGLACALLGTPKLLILDEPSVGVDPLSRRELWSMVSELMHEGISVVWSTSYLDEAERCSLVLLLNQGRSLFFGPPRDFTQRVEGRTFHAVPRQGNHRQLLFHALQDPQCIDGVIQGSYVRCVCQDTVGCLHDYAVCTTTPPRFEDAFVDLLKAGGLDSKETLMSHTRHTDGAEDVIVARDLCKRFGSFTAVDHLNLSVKRGVIFGLLGPNGAGKTTTFKMLCGLLPPSSGSASVHGVDLRTASHIARNYIGYMSQKFSLYGQLSVQQNLSFFASMYGLEGTQKQHRIAEMVQIFQLTPYLTEAAQILPLGYQQRLALACANLHQPPILFLDEPTSGVDPLTRRAFWNQINSLVDQGVTVMVTTHFMDEAEYCDEIALVYKGNIICQGSPDSLKNGVGTTSATLEEAFIHYVEQHGG